MKKYYIKTFGCQMNEYDSEKISSALQSLGYVQSEDYKDCDLALLNTCSIRAKPDEKVYSDLGRINLEKKRLQKLGKYMIIVVTGCVPETFKKAMFQRAPYIDILLGPQSYIKLKDFIKQIAGSFTQDENSLIVPQITKLSDFEFNTFDKFDFLNEEKNRSNNISPMISVQEGCDKFCTYCVVPNTRGRQVSRPAKDIFEEIKKVIDFGAKEVMFLGQNVTAYNDNGITLADLIYETSKFNEIKRIKYTTSHPRDMHDNIIKAHKTIEKLSPYLHLPAQSGSDKILKKMNRKYTSEEYLNKINAFRQARPDIIFSSDFIVGFPGETEEDFQDTLNLIEKVNYQANCFSFCYSIRPGTVAGIMKDQVDQEVSSERLQRIQTLLNKQRDDFNNGFLNNHLEVLFDNTENKHSMQISGKSQFMQTVIINVKSEEEKLQLLSQIKKVKITKINANSLFGELAE